MSSLALTMVPGRSTRGACGVLQRRWTHKSPQKQAIIMPAISPLMMEGKVTRWKVREGQSFVPGDVLLQIENEIAIVDVEANNAGILGKILIPDGTEHVPIQQILALVARDETELSQLQNESNASFITRNPSPPTFISTPDPPSISITARRREMPGQLPLNPPKSPSRKTRTPSLYEMQTMGFGHRTAVAATDSRSEDTTAPTETPQTTTRSQPKEVPFADGASIRRMIVTNLTRTSRSRAADEAIF